MPISQHTPCIRLSQQYPRYWRSLVHTVMSGYPLDSFVGPVDETLLCRICRKVLNSPRKTPCGHVFCLSCLSSWIEYYGVCPNRCGDVEFIELTRPFDVEERVFCLLKRCKYFSMGCKTQGRLFDIEQLHEKVCTYQHCGNRQQQPIQPPLNPEEMKRTVAPSLDCLFGRFGKAKKRPSTNTKPGDIQTVHYGGGVVIRIRLSYYHPPPPHPTPIYNCVLISIPAVCFHFLFLACVHREELCKLS